jgi:hypothetical protein
MEVAFPVMLEIFRVKILFKHTSAQVVQVLALFMVNVDYTITYVKCCVQSLGKLQVIVRTGIVIVFGLRRMEQLLIRNV